MNMVSLWVALSLQELKETLKVSVHRLYSVFHFFDY